jgi:hypothetical protein
MKRIPLIVMAICLIGGLLIARLVVSVRYGSFQGLLAEYRTLPKAETLSSLRNDTQEKLTHAQAEFASISGLTPYAQSHSTMCTKGEHNWKIDDPHAYVCSYRLTYYYGTHREYTTLLLELEQSLRDQGWHIRSGTPVQLTIGQSLEQYSGNIFSVPLPVYTKTASDGRSMNVTINGFNGASGALMFADEEPYPFDFGVGVLNVLQDDHSTVSPKAIYDSVISAQQQPLVISISEEYFRN